MQDKKAWLRSLIVDFLETDVNRMGGNFGDEKMWDTPLIGFASGADDIFNKYKSPEVCGIEHWTPAEAFAKAYPESKFTPDELTTELSHLLLLVDSKPLFFVFSVCYSAENQWL